MAIEEKRYPGKILYEESHDGRSLMSLIRQMEEEENAKPESERVPVDTYGCDCIFIGSFVPFGEDIDRDFTLIARDFLKHEFANIDKYDDLVYAKPDDGESWTNRMIQYHILNLMFNAYRGGSTYAAALFRYLYKTYYKKEYKQFKRFTKLTAGDVLTLASTDDDLDADAMARILTMGEMFGMEISASCKSLYAYLIYQHNLDESHTYYDEKLMDDFTGRYDAAADEVSGIFGSDEAIYKKMEKMSRFTGKALNLHSYCSDYLDLCDDEGDDVINTMTEALMLLRRVHPSREFTKDELAVYCELYHAIRAVIWNTNNLDWCLTEIIYGEEAASRFEINPPKFDPDAIEVTQVKSKPAQEPVKPVRKEEKQEYSQEALLAEIESLRLKNHKQESQIKSLRAEMSDRIKLSEENRRLAAQYDSDRKELIALRDHVYNLTEEDEADDSTPLQTMIDELKEQRIIIIGGHPKWINKMKGYFPDWDYISPSPTGTIPASIVEKADKVYFFTDTISHSAYYKYINAVRERNVKFGYIHGVNVEKCVRGLWRERMV